MGPRRWKTLAELQRRTPKPYMSGIGMEWAEGGVRGWGGKDWGAKCSQGARSQADPIGTPPRHPVPRPKKPLTPNEGMKPEVHIATNKKIEADQLAQVNKNMPQKGGHATNMPNHPRTHRAEPTERSIPDAPQPGTGPQPQSGQRGNKTHTTLTPRPPISHTIRPTQMQAPSQHRHMYPPIDKRTETTRAPASQAVKQTLRRTTPPTTVPKGGAGPGGRRLPQKGHSTHSKEAAYWVTYPPGPKPPGSNQDPSPGATPQEPQAHPRPAQEQHSQ
ncbi:hypothetical protein CRENBAI_004859 [Crenichthys baileyi]|uniref:Uncharacterized protein n=1 Tax=Crenichthys baileyi TaxID=28760 RepID=A0AAV9RN01_9TELE